MASKVGELEVLEALEKAMQKIEKLEIYKEIFLGRKKYCNNSRGI